MRLSGGLQYLTQGFRQANNFASSLISRSVQLAGTDTIAASGDLADASTRQIGQVAAAIKRRTATHGDT